MEEKTVPISSSDVGITDPDPETRVTYQRSSELPILLIGLHPFNLGSGAGLLFARSSHRTFFPGGNHSTHPHLVIFRLSSIFAILHNTSSKAFIIAQIYLRSIPQFIMKTLRTTVTRSLRSNIIPPSSQVPKVASRGITLTTRKSTTIERTPTRQHPTPFLPHIFNPQPTTPKRRHTQEEDPNPFATLTTHLTYSLATHPHGNLPRLTALLRSYSSDPAHWSRFAHANPGKQYTRNLVASVPGVFNLLLLVWTPGKKSPVHDHAGAHCLMKVLRGALVERRWGMPEGEGEGDGEEMREIGRRRLGEGRVGYMSDEMGVHEISNPSEVDYAVSLHLYTPPNASTKGCRVFDQESGEATLVMQGEWDSVDGLPT